MQDEPTPTELIKAVADFLRTEIAPVIQGHNAFKLRVGINALDLVTRQLTLEQGGDAAEHASGQISGADIITGFVHRHGLLSPFPGHSREQDMCPHGG